ncbi:MAG: hypothetical protein EOO75_13960 [Myxococcales bacterium]|nr:MAG: hypothetical protein EOO75_13960 [Myxococcales bacterium]
MRGSRKAQGRAVSVGSVARRVCLGALVLVALAGCNGGQQGPSAALRSYAEAIRERRVEAAYAMLSTEARRSVSLEAFRRMVLENPGDADELARSLARPTTDPLVTATVTTAQGDELLLVFEHGRWRIDGESVDFYSQATPRQAIRSFLRAFERRRFDVLLRFVPDAKKVTDERYPALDEARLRESWEGPQREEMERISQGLKAALPQASIEETVDRATMSYGDRGTVQLVREQGAWKIEDFD